MKRVLSFLVVAVVSISPAACGAKKLPEPVAARSRGVLSTLRGLSSAYEHKDLDAFLSFVAPGYSGREAFSTSLAAVFSKYDAIRFDVQYPKMLIMIEHDGPIRASFNWDAEWSTDSGMNRKNGGRVTLVLQPGTYKLLSIEGKDPFLPRAEELPDK
jgi:hypothetical protein